MGSYIKSPRKYRILLFFMVAAIVSVIVCILFIPAGLNNDGSAANGQPGALDIKHQFIAGDEPMAVDVSSKAIKLQKPSTIDSVTLSYIKDGEWIEITSDSTDLPADAGYQLKIEYDNITAQELLDADCQMVYEKLPDWFSPNQTGVLTAGEDVVADIECKDGRVVVTFKEDWLKQQDTNKLHGFFKINGSVVWKELLEEGAPAPSLPGLDLDLNFEDDLVSKYASLSIQKSTPEVVRQGDDYYLKYEIIVENMDEDVFIPDVYVIDTFKSNAGYILGYVGVSADLTEPAAFYPQQDSSQQPFENGRLTISGDSMRWDIGELRASEKRTLTYYAKINPSYIVSAMNSRFKNTADVFSGDTPKGGDTAEYTPKRVVDLKKVLTGSKIDSTGSGTLEYEITITAPDTNDYKLTDLTLDDVFPPELSSFLEIVSVNGMPVSASPFPIKGIDLEPGGKYTVKYTVAANYIFAAGNGDIDLVNAASVSSTDSLLAQDSHHETLKQNNWMRKVYGEPLNANKTIEIPASDTVYDAQKQPVPNSGMSFEVHSGSLQYQVVLNEDGRWDLSNATLADAFGDEYMRYCGYVQIRIYEQGSDFAGDAPDDEELIGRLGSKTPYKTVWLYADGLDSFAFSPNMLGLDGDKYTFLLTYYAKPQGVDNIGAFVASNSFEISGEVGYGDGESAGKIRVTGMKFTVSGVVRGGVDYDVTKTGWYYEPQPIENVVNSNDYSGGALYWVIRLEGDIPKGNYELNGNGTIKSLSGFRVIDNPTNSSLARDSVAGVYIGPKTLDFSHYSSYGSFLFKEVQSKKLRSLNGNRENGKYFSVAGVTDPDYIWSASASQFEGLVFIGRDDNDNIALHLSDDEAVYIIVRTFPGADLSASSHAVYRNEVYVNGSPQNIFMDSAELTFSNALYKESKGAYTYDAETGTTKKCDVSYYNNADGWQESSLDWNYIKEHCGSGTYAPWLVNVNWNGTMQGTADVSDILPKGMELACCDILWIGNEYSAAARPKCEEIPELDQDDSWQRYDKINPGHTEYGSAITYYNPETGELRWRISGLAMRNNDSGKNRELNLRVVCKVTDQDVFLSRGEKTFENTMYCGEDSSSATVTIARDGCIDKQIIKDGLGENGGVLTNDHNSLPFKIEINPLAEDMCEQDHLPALIDELSYGLYYVPDSLRIEAADGEPIKGYSYTIREDNGRQTLIILNLPDNKKFTIYYDTRIDAKPGTTVEHLGNNAYWAGYPSDDSQVKDASFKYEIGGNVFSSELMSVTITKVDSADYNIKLEGAEFEIYEVGKDGGLTRLESDVTKATGKVMFPVDDRNNRLYCNKLYCIMEKTAPNGYKRNDAAHYFAVVSDENAIDLSGLDPQIVNQIDFWYESPEYSITMPNDKGEISVNKVFKDENGRQCEPVAGSYSFGLFHYENDNTPLETLKIVYEQDGSVKYYLDGVETGSACFAKYDQALVYYVFELDSSGSPIRNDQKGEINGITFRVNYFDKNGKQSNSVAVNSVITVENMRADNEVALELPGTGAGGLNRIYLLGSMLLCISLLILMYAGRCADPKKKTDKAHGKAG